MQKFLLIFVFVFLPNSLVFSYQCVRIEPKKMLSISSYVFTGSVTSKDKETASISVLKVYKGSLPQKLRIRFPHLLSKDYRALDNLEINQNYLFSSSSELPEKTNVLDIDPCDWAQETLRSKKIIDALDGKSTSLKNKQGKTTPQRPTD